MMDNEIEYPERPPVDLEPLTKFWFSPHRLDATLRDLELQLDALETRISNIVAKCDVQGTPVLAAFLRLTHDPADYRLVARCLTKLAEIMPEYDRLEARRNFVDQVANDPGWIAAAFGDFSDELDALDRARPFWTH